MSPPGESQTDPWSLWVADAATATARAVWQGPQTSRGSYPRTLGGANLDWAAGDRLVFLADLDGWPHLYSVSAGGGSPTLLTPGRFMVEYVSLSPDGKTVVYNANAGPDPDDGERRHVFRVAVDGGAPTALTEGAGIEWAPVVTADQAAVAYIASDGRRPGLVHVRALDGGAPRALQADLLAPDFPASRLVLPQHVVVTASDGTPVHCQLFRSQEGPRRRPAVVFVHGGPPRQMLLGWNYQWYYAYAYSVHQYLASRGFVVASVNYRLGIGYGHEFHNPERSGPRGASEYQDVLAAGKYLQSRPDVDPRRIGIWGGSYGGYLTALALGRNSDVFAAGVDLHGRHDFTSFPSQRQQLAAAVGDGIDPGHLAETMRTAWESSPIAWVKTWKSPVLFIHGDDDRNVPVEQTVDLVQRLRRAGVSHEEMILPDEIHAFLLHRSWLKVNAATAAFFEKTLGHDASDSGASP
jgi:dipeptidyl aminopeptidase/acylaminoacyl peptidase